MKRPNKFLMTWHSKYADGEFSKFNWKQRTHVRSPQVAAWGDNPYLLENLETGQIIATNFGIREHAHYATTDWPVRQAAVRALKRWQQLNTPEALATKELKTLRKRQLAWRRKIKSGQTRLAKVNTAIKRITKKFPALAV